MATAEERNAEDKAVVEQFFATRFHDHDTARSLVAEDARWIIPGRLPLSGTYEGRDAIFRDYLGQHTNDFKEVTSSVLRTIAEDGCVVVEYHATGTTVKDRPYDTIYYYVVDVRDGLIRQVRQALDTQYAIDVIYT
jgi:ketosteroid isomerase-like protein